MAKNKKNKQSPVATKKPPIVAVLGHVDHGKTSLLDAIRQTRLQEKEAGGITQSIGAYQIVHKDQPITFIDTPGHEAFTAMRARGGGAADVVILVIAASEGIKPQTIESIGHAKAAGVPVIIALNKVDLPGANPQKVKQELLQHDVVVEELGGDTVAVEVSAKTGAGIEQLLEMIVLVTEMQELEADPTQVAAGVVLEARRDTRQGIVTSLLVKEGELHFGDFVVIGSTWGKIKRMQNWLGETITTAGPATPVEVLGLQAVPKAGEQFRVVSNEKEAQQEMLQASDVMPIKQTVTEEGKKVVPLIVKTDTQGALEAFVPALESLNSDEGIVQIVHAGLSNITEADVMLATVSQAIILGYNVEADKAAQNAAHVERVPIMLYQVIYQALEDVAEFLESEVEQIRAVGAAEVREVFELSDGNFVAGSIVNEGYFTRGAKVQVVRDDEVVFEGRIGSLRHGKEERSKIEAGTECGIRLTKNFQFELGDILIAYP